MPIHIKVKEWKGVYGDSLEVTLEDHDIEHKDLKKVKRWLETVDREKSKRLNDYVSRLEWEVREDFFARVRRKKYENNRLRLSVSSEMAIEVVKELAEDFEVTESEVVRLLLEGLGVDKASKLITKQKKKEAKT